jgi:hypothetical protein
MVVVLCVVAMSLFIHSRISLYMSSFSLVRSCCMHVEMVMIGELSRGLNITPEMWSPRCLGGGMSIVFCMCLSFPLGWYPPSGGLWWGLISGMCVFVWIL